MHQQRYNFHGSCAFYIHHLKSSTNKSSEPILEHMVNSIPMDFSLVLSSIPVGSSCRTRPSHKSSWSVTGFPWNMDDDHPPKRCFRKPKKHWWTGMSHRFTNGFQYKWGIMRIYDLIAIEWWFQMVVLHGTKKKLCFWVHQGDDPQRLQISSLCWFCWFLVFEATLMAQLLGSTSAKIVPFPVGIDLEVSMLSSFLRDLACCDLFHNVSSNVSSSSVSNWGFP